MFGDSQWGESVVIGRQLWIPLLYGGHVVRWVLIDERHS